MNGAVIHLLFVGIPLGLVAVLALLTFSRKGNHPATYQLSERWTHEPILWAAVEEVVPGDGHHGATETTVGGGASGKW
ncbi:hypothetical protein BayCH28_22145 [Mycolicibacterium sp. CH28]|uniref:aa3-type cytochrome oxidase subunit CtaJ n=1 Tax=Mycolicibacterium sp. CH28 TaxID=2512237 RepID=UPI001081109A|nr:hypothetical protein [Mycolicibacterium sp. CH28]TGD85109.1 hypothetical protein BayCH28_22145 [Mycolicibacterium sp. CH28]